MERTLLLGGMATPALGIAMFAVVVLLTPGHDVVCDPPSWLGVAGAAHPGLFNGPLLAIALICLLCAPALGTGLVRNGASAPLSGLAALNAALVAVSLATVALFPVPSLLHGGFHLSVVGHVLPALGAAALRGAGGGRCRPWLLVAISAASSAACLACRLHGPCGIDARCFGLQVELLTLAYFVSVGVLCHAALPVRTGHGAAAVRAGRVEGGGRHRAPFGATVVGGMFPNPARVLARGGIGPTLRRLGATPGQG